MSDRVPGYSLVHPVYLDGPMMESFLAHIEDGIYTEEEQTTTATAARERLIKGRAGLRARFGIASGEAEGEASFQKNDQTALETKRNRHHTAASLFNLLYAYLREDGLVVDVATEVDLGALQPGQLVEVAGQYLGNPLELSVNYFTAMIPYLRQQQTAEDEAEQKGQSRQKQSNAKQRNQPRGGGRPNQTIDPEAMIQSALNDVMQHSVDAATKRQTELAIVLLEQVTQDLAHVPVHDALIQSETGLRAVITLDSEFFSPSTNEYLRDGEFRVVGKVTRVVREGQTINLARRTVFGAFSDQATRGMLDGFSSTSDESESEMSLDVPDPIVEGPCLQILPMAVFI